MTNTVKIQLGDELERTEQDNFANQNQIKSMYEKINKMNDRLITAFKQDDDKDKYYNLRTSS